MNFIKENWKRYFISSLQTFFSVFLPLFIPELLVMDWNNLNGAVVLALVVTAIRAGIKAVIELWFPKKY